MSRTKLHNVNLPVTTQLPEFLYNKARSTECVSQGLSVAQQTRLRRYQERLTITTGLGDQDNFDKEMKALLLRYTYHPDEIQDIITKLNNTFGQRTGLPFRRTLKSWDWCADQLARFIEPNWRNFGWNEHYRAAYERLRKELSSYSCHPLRFHNDDEIREALSKLDTHSGWTWVESGFKEKGKNVEGVWKRWNDAFEYAKEHDLNMRRPILLGFRTQASGEFDEGHWSGAFKEKSRIVNIICLLQIVSELVFSKPFNEVVVDAPMFAAGKNDLEVRSWIDARKGKYGYFASLDYSHFDQSISAWLIRDAFNIVRSCFCLDVESNREFDVVVNSFIEKDLVIDRGVLHSVKGVPSGSQFTQVIDSIVNLLVIYTYLSAKGISGESTVMGDDNLVFTNVELDMIDFSSYVAHNFGLEINADKSNQGTNYDEPTFLSRKWTNEGPDRAWCEVVSRMLYPERFRPYHFGEVQPYEVLLAYAYTYRCVSEKVNLAELKHMYRVNEATLKNIASRYIPGSISYMRDYVLATGLGA